MREKEKLEKEAGITWKIKAKGREKDEIIKRQKEEIYNILREHKKERERKEKEVDKLKRDLREREKEKDKLETERNYLR